MSKIIKISNKKSVSKIENNQIERLEKQLLELEEETQTTQNRASDYAQNKSKIDSAYSTANSNSTAISGLTARVATAEQNITNLSSAITTNTQSISSLSANVSSQATSISNLSSSLDSHVQDYNSLNERFANVVQVVAQHGGRIMDIDADIIQLKLYKQGLLTAGTGISIDQNNVISATGGGSGGLSEVTASNVNSQSATNGQVLTADGQGGASWQNASGGTDYSTTIATLQSKVSALETYVDNFNQMIHDRNAIYNTPYEAIDQNDVMQTHDSTEIEYDYTGSSSFRTCMFNFYVHPNTTTLSLKITLKISGSAAGTGKIDLYFNSFSNSVLQNFEYSTADQLVELYFTPTVSTSDNYFFAIITPQSGQTIHLSHLKAEVYNCTNPIIFTKVRQFYVDYYGGYYYIHDCRGSTVKRAIVNVNDITALDNLTWTDTNIPAMTMITLAKVNTSTNPFSLGTISYAYIDKEGHQHFINNHTGQNKDYPTLSCAMLSTGQPNGYAGFCYTEVLNETTRTIRRVALSNSSTVSTSNLLTDPTIAYAQGVQSPFDYLMNESTSIYVEQNSNGTCRLRFGNQYFNLGFGRVVNCYFRDNSYYKFDIYMNIYGKIIKHQVNYDYSNNIYTLISSTEVGYYDYFMQGVNGDYFVIKDKKLFFYKNTPIS